MPAKKTSSSKKTTKKADQITRDRRVRENRAASKKPAKPRSIKVVEETKNGDVVEVPEPAPAAKPTKKAKAPKADKRVSAIDAAFRVLSESGQPMNTRSMIEVMTSNGYWNSPAGKTPHATLYSAILREIKDKGADSRFRKTERGQFEAANRS